MRKLGLIGGMSWQSTAIYYRHMNEIARARLGDLHSADLVMRSLDFAEVAERQHSGDWDGLADMLVAAGRDLEKAGAEALVLCTNTMHLLAERIEAAIAIPLIHIADATASAIHQSAARNPALLATRFTMERDFYRDRLLAGHGVPTIIPDEAGRLAIHRIIYEELCEGIVKPESKSDYVAEVERLRQQGADGVILGCTEITMLIGQDDFDIPVFDTTWLHSKAAMDFALGGGLSAKHKEETA
ncbi:MAG TPA: aspartate/glutamate racemase family protein [Nordella sp.]|nr:aspartate/glutamate racemase family protein [Nordella sp.]